ATARTNLGLGNSATRNVGTTAGTVAAGDDSRITGALQSSNVPTKAEAEAGTSTTPRAWTAERIKEAIKALGGSGGGALSAVPFDISSSANGSTTAFDLS